MKPTKKSDVLLNFERQEWGVFLGEVPEDSEKNSNLCIFGDGEYLLRNNKIGTFFRKLKDSSVPSLEEGPEPFFKYSLPKIPISILKQQVSFYREVMKKWNNAEAYSIIFFDTEKQEYFLIIPDQKISKASVGYNQEDLRKTYPSSRYIEVISAHSHNDMASFFSSIDDNDERGDFIYMVMGRLNRDVPSFKIRANVAGKEVTKLKLEDIFQCSYEDWSLFSPGWKNHHEEEWLSHINVSGNYYSPHQQNSISFGYNFTKSSGKNKGNSYISKSTGFQQLNFGPFIDLSDDDAVDSDSRVLTQLAIELISDSRRMTPKFALKSFLERLCELGYGSEFVEAAQNSSMSLYLYDDYDEYFDEDGNLIEENLPSYNYDDIELSEESFLQELWEEYEMEDKE